MSDDNTMAAIAALATAALVAKREIQNSRADGRAEWADISSQTLMPVIAALGRISVVSDLIGRLVVYPNGVAVFDLNSAALHLTHRSTYIAASTVTQDFLKICKERIVRFVEVRLLTNVEILQTIDLGGEFKVCPLAEVPRTESTCHLLSQENVPAHGWGRPPAGAVVKSSTYELTFYEPPKSGTLPPSLVTANDEQRWQDAFSAIILASDGIPEFRQQYSIITSPGWFLDPCSSFSASERFPVMGRPASNIHAVTAAHAFRIVQNSNSTLRLAIRVLEQSRGRPSSVERALDLGLCAEILLMSGAKDNSEIGFKIATRAAWLLGRDAEERVAIFKSARVLYQDRSNSAHTGSLGKIKNMNDVTSESERLSLSDKLCVNLILKLAEQGFPSDWNLITLNVI